MRDRLRHRYDQVDRGQVGGDHRRRRCRLRLRADTVEEERYRDPAEGREAALQRRAGEARFGQRTHHCSGERLSGEDIEFIARDEAVKRLAAIKDQLEQLLSGRYIPADKWSSWWSKARTALPTRIEVSSLHQLRRNSIKCSPKDMKCLAWKAGM